MGLSDEAVRRLRTETFGEDTFAGRFELLGEVASGGMSRVFEGVDRATGARVAIKLLLGGEDRVRFAAEAEMLERLGRGSGHPSLVRYIRHGENTDGVPYLAMEWLAGETLAHRLERGPLSVLDATELGAQLADALAYLHGEGIIHRDLKPSNVFLVDGGARLIDLGIAKAGDLDLTRTGQIVGTPGYMAPEQARGDKTADARSDLFALGCVLYEALAGKPPFEGTAVMEVLARLLLHTPPPIEMVATGVPPRLAKLVEALLAKSPAARLADAGAARAELAAIAAAIRAGDRAALDAPATAASTPTVVARPGPRPRRRWPYVVLGVLLAFALVGLLVWLRPGSASRCNDGDARACVRLGERSLADEPHTAIRAFARACDLGSLAACSRGAAISEAMRGAGQLAASEALIVQHGLFDQGCRRGDAALCFELGRRLAPQLGTFPPDAGRAYALVAQACQAKHRDACVFLETMLARRVGDPQQQQIGRAAYRAACEAKTIACVPASGATNPPHTAPGGDAGADRDLRKQVAALASLQGRYLDPCWPDDQIRFWGRALETGAEGDAFRDLARYRNVLDCKHVTRQLVVGSHIEDDFHAALARGDAATAKTIAGKLLALARALVVDEPFVRRRLATVEQVFARRDAVANSVLLAAMLADARAELAAGHVGAANLVLDELAREANTVLAEAEPAR